MAYASFSVVFGEQPSAAKWNILGTNDASFNDGTGIGASAITPEKLFTGTGTSWPRTSYSPTLTNITIGNGTSSFYYKQIGKDVFVQGRLIFGSTSSITGVIDISLPVTAISGHYQVREPIGTGMAFHNASGGYFPCYVIYTATTTVRLVALTTQSGSNPVFGDISSARDVASTVPFSSAGTSDVFSFSLSYEAA